MSALGTIFRAELRNVLRSRWVVSYTLLMAGLATLLVQFGGSGTRALLSLVNVVLLLVPLVTVLFGTLYVYNAREFNIMLLAQPVSRGTLYLGLFGGISLPLAGAFALGAGLPLGLQLLREPAIARPLAMFLATGLLLTLVFSALALCVAVLIQDRARGLAAALTVWLVCTVVYDGLVLLVLTTFREYPLEGAVLALTLVNPIDLARVLLLLTLDIAALMGYTGVVFETAFGSSIGIAAGFTMLVVCVAVPLLVGAHWFRRKDL